MSLFNSQLSTLNSPLIPPGYKQTEVGVIPEEWDVFRLDALGIGSTPPIKAGPFGSALTKDTYVPTGYKVYGQEQVIRGDHLYGDYFITLKKYRELESCAVRPGDVLLSLVGTVGKLLAVPDDAPPGIINPRLIRFSFDKGRVCPRFFTFLFESGVVQSLLERKAQGGTMGVLNAGILRPFPIQLPSLPEQRAIATALSDVDGLLGGLDRLIAKKRDLKQAAMQQLLTAQTRLPGFHGEWELKRLGDVCGRITTGKLDANAMVADGDYPFFTCARQNYMIDKYAFDYEALLVSGNGANVGYVHYYKGKFNAYQRTYVISEFTADVQFIEAFLVRNIQDRIRVEVNAGNTPYITMGTLTEMEITLPPSLPEQTAIAEVLTEMDAELAGLEQRREKTRALKQAMMQELLTGRVRLIENG